MAKKPVKPVKKSETGKKRASAKPKRKEAEKKASKTERKTTGPVAMGKTERGRPAKAVTTRAKTAVKMDVPKPVGPARKKSAAGSREEILRKHLIRSREEIVREAKSEIGKYIKGETRQLVESVLDDGDWSVIDLSEDINLRRLAKHREVLLKIDEALRKMKEGTYGTCEDCGEEINTARLEVLPFAIYCRDCQEKREELEKMEEEEL
ncbi:MAG TPA: TraR/DksA family transcriptional regulator [Thermodesulfovibrionales bacterium]|nr:TraR/DksA family transcriptional regulator [Thermodesulfovibrionales bacterium]